MMIGPHNRVFEDLDFNQAQRRLDKIYVLTDDKGTGEVIESQAIELGYECAILNEISDFRVNYQSGQRYCLVIDYHFIREENSSPLLDLIHSSKESSAAGLLVIAETEGCAEFIDHILTHYSDWNHPFFFLERSFSIAEFQELLFRLENVNKHISIGCLRLPKYNFLHTEKMGYILQAARENLGLETHQVAMVACENGISLSVDRLREIEADETGTSISAREWFVLTQLLFESSDCVRTGVHPRMQLGKVRRAIKEKSYPFAMNFTVRRKLVELEKREQIESKFSDLMRQRFS